MNDVRNETYAFPQHPGTGNLQEDWRYGMTLRDWFAGQALIGLIMNPASVSIDSPLTIRAYEIANHMMEARELP